MDMPWRVYKCKHKTSVGNIFTSQADADQEAVYLTLEREIEIVGYKCQVCPWWHVGSTAKLKYYQRLEKQRQKAEQQKKPKRLE